MNYVPGRLYYYRNNSVRLNAIWFEEDKGFAAITYWPSVGFRKADVVDLASLVDKKTTTKRVNLCVELKKDNTLEVTFRNIQLESVENFYQTSFNIEVPNEV